MWVSTIVVLAAAELTDPAVILENAIGTTTLERPANVPVDLPREKIPVHFHPARARSRGLFRRDLPARRPAGKLADGGPPPPRGPAQRLRPLPHPSPGVSRRARA